MVSFYFHRRPSTFADMRTVLASWGESTLDVALFHILKACGEQSHQQPHSLVARYRRLSLALRSLRHQIPSLDTAYG